MTKLYEASTSAFEPSHLATPQVSTPNTPNTASWLKKATLLFTAPAIFAAIHGAVVLTHPAHPSPPVDVAACRASLCSGFQVPRPVFSYEWDYDHKKYIPWLVDPKMTEGNQEANCLANFTSLTEVACKRGTYLVSFSFLPTGLGEHAKAVEPCAITHLEGPVYLHNRKKQHSAMANCITAGVLSDVIILGSMLVMKLRSFQNRQWLTANMQASLSPSLYYLVQNYAQLSELEQQEACEELMPVLQKLLTESVERSDTDTVDVLLSLGVSPNSTVDGRKSALEISLVRRSDDLSLKLVEHTTSLTAKHLDTAARVGDIATVMKIIAQLQTREGYTQQMMQQLFQQLPDDFLFALSVSTKAGGTSISALLNELGSECKRLINARDSFGRTPLHIASFWNGDDAVENLLAHGADMQIIDNFGKTPEDMKNLRTDLKSSI